MDCISSTNPLKLAKDGNGVEPLFLHIKAKAPAFGGMQEQFRKIVNELGLEVVERRTNRNSRGLSATVQTALCARDTTMTVQLQKIEAQKKMKRSLAHTMQASESSGRLNEVNQGLSTRGLSSNNLSHLSLVSLEKEAQDALQETAKEEDAIIARGNLFEKKIEEALGADADAIVDVWNPWPWTEVLEKLGQHYGATSDSSQENVEVFVAVFDKIDADGGVSIDQQEMCHALDDADLDITEEGVMTLFAMIDEDGNGDIDHDEWRGTVQFYLGLKAEETEISNETADLAQLKKNKGQEVRSVRQDRRRSSQAGSGG